MPFNLREMVSPEHGIAPAGIKQLLGAELICLAVGETRLMQMWYARQLSDMIGVHTRHYAQQAMEIGRYVLANEHS